MAFESAFATLEHICDQTRQQLASYRAQRPGDDDGAFIEQSVKEFIRAGSEQTDQRPGLRNMALSVYSIVLLRDALARASEREAELADALAMRGDALELAWSRIDDLEKLLPAEEA